MRSICKQLGRKTFAITANVAQVYVHLRNCVVFVSLCGEVAICSRRHIQLWPNTINHTDMKHRKSTESVTRMIVITFEFIIIDTL